MAYTIRMEGMEELSGQLEKLGDKAQDVAALALYEGAGVVADAVSQAVQGIATAPFRYARGGRKRLPSPEEKAILTKARTGVAKFRKTGVSVQTSIGMQNAGYAQLGSKMKPIPLIANAIESGTSFMTKQPLIRKAARKAESRAAAVTEQGIESRIKDLELEG